MKYFRFSFFNSKRSSYGILQFVTGTFLRWQLIENLLKSSYLTYPFTFLTYSNKIFYIIIVKLCRVNMLQVVRMKDGAYGSCRGRRPGRRAPARLREQRPAQTPSRAQLSPGPTRLMSHTHRVTACVSPAFVCIH